MKRHLRQWGLAMLMTVFTLSLQAAPRTEDDCLTFLRWVKTTSRRPEVLPPLMSRDGERDTAIRRAAAELLEAGAARAREFAVVNERAVKSFLGDRVWPEPRLRLRLYQDTGTGRYFVGSEKEDSDGLSWSAWFFYENYFAAYAGLHPDFRRCDSPLARGVAALAALNNSYPGNLALLPDFKAEAAAAVLLLNADPGLIEIMRENGPGNSGLRERTVRALEKVFQGAPGAAERAAESAPLLLGDLKSPISPLDQFDLRTVLGPGNELRDAAWNFAGAAVAYPGLLAEIGSAVWARRQLDPETVSRLDAFFGERLLGQFREEITARGIGPADITGRAVFDVGQASSLFGFVWAYRPEFETWRGKVAGAATGEDGSERDQRRRDLVSRLADMLVLSRTGSVGPAAELCALFALDPFSRAASQPRITLEFGERSVREPSGGEEADKYVETARLVLRWKMNRPLANEETDFEEIVFAGSAAVEAPEGIDTPGRKPLPVAPGPGDAPADGQDPEESGTDPGEKKAETGVGTGDKGIEEGGKTPSRKPPPPSESLGFGPDTGLLWRETMDAEAAERPLAEAGPGGLAATVLIVLSPQPSAAPLRAVHTIWSQVAGAGREPQGTAIRILLDDGKELVLGVDQELFLHGEEADRSRKARELKPGVLLLGRDGRPVRIAEIKQIEEPVELIQPTMANYRNLLVEGVLARVGALEQGGGILGEMLAESPAGPVAVRSLKEGSAVLARLEDRAGAEPTRVFSVARPRVEAFVELRYDLEDRERVLRIAATQKVLVWIPEVKLQTYACASPELLKYRGAAPEESPETDWSAGDQEAETVLKLTPGMLLVTATSGPDEPRAVTELKSIAARGEEVPEEEKHERGYETSVPVLYNLRLLSVEGVLLHVPTEFENVSGFLPRTAVIQPPEGLPPGAPIRMSDITALKSTAIGVIPCPAGPFLTVIWPEKTWMTDRTESRPGNSALRYLRIETGRGVLSCGNLQLFIAVRGKETKETVVVPAEALIQDPGNYQLLFVDRDQPQADGELELVPVRAAEYVYGERPTALAEITGSGIAGREERPVRGEDGREVMKTVFRDIYFADGFMVVKETEEDLAGGGSVAGGGGGAGRIAPDESLSERPVRIQFRLPGLETGAVPARENRIQFRAEERKLFDEMLDNVQEAYGRSRWGSGRILDPDRFQRFLALYFPAADREPKVLAAAYAEPDGAGAPPWTAAAFQEYLVARASLFEHGIPSDLFQWSFRYVFLVTLAYETGNRELGDALLREFLCVTMTIALGRNEEQKTRPLYYDREQYRLTEALLWSRDVASIIRDGGDGRRAWVEPRGWDDLLRSNLPLLTEAGGLNALLGQDGRVEIGNLWVQLRKKTHGEGAGLAADMDPELQAALQAATGDAESRASFLITSPSQDPAALFEGTKFPEGPYAGRTIRQVLGVRDFDPGP